jgi:hypothetical protein
MSTAETDVTPLYEATSDPDVLELLPAQSEVGVIVDHATRTLARSFARTDPNAQKDEEGYTVLAKPKATTIYHLVELATRVRPAPNTDGSISEIPSIWAKIEAEKNELKAKVFLVALSFAARAQNPERYEIATRDLMTQLGYVLKTKNNSGTYWQVLHQIMRYLVVDLPNTHVRSELRYNGQTYYGLDYLMHRVRPYWQQRTLGDFDRILLEGILEPGIRVPKLALPDRLRLGFGEDSCKLLGLGLVERNAREDLPTKIMRLRGPAFWLAYHVAFLRRWTQGPQDPKRGALVLKQLEDLGYLEQHTRDGCTRFGDALKAWGSDLKKLANLGVLAGDGATLWHPSHDAPQALQSMLASPTKRITRGKLENIRVLYLLPEPRMFELATARTNARRQGDQKTVTKPALMVTKPAQTVTKPAQINENMRAGRRKRAYKAVMQ